MSPVLSFAFNVLCVFVYIVIVLDKLMQLFIFNGIYLICLSVIKWFTSHGLMDMGSLGYSLIIFPSLFFRFLVNNDNINRNQSF